VVHLAALFRVCMDRPTLIEFGVYGVDLAAGELRKQGLRIKLQAQPFGILAMLLERPGVIVTREELQQKLWPTDVFVDFDQGLNKAINKLRDALGDVAENPRFVETVPKKGYRFIAPVKVVSGPAGPDPHPIPPPALSLKPLRYVALGVVATIALVLAGLVYLRSQKLAPMNSLAVLPMVNTGGDPNLEYLGDGITESIINNLSQLSGFRVMARSTVFHYKGRDTDAREVGQRLGVRAVLMGRVSQIGDHLVIDTELINASDGSQIWGEQYNRKFSDLLSVQEEIARQITSNLQLRLSGQQQQLLARRVTEDSDAYQLYLRGRYYFNKRTDEGFLKAADYFRQAIDRDAGYGLAYAGLADCYGLLAWDTYPPREYFPKARQMAEKALAIDSEMAEAHTSLAMIRALYDWDWNGAEAEFRRAIELNPGYATAHHWYGIHLGAMGRLEDSRRELMRALDLDPLSLIINVNNAYPYHYNHQYDRAVEIYKKAIDMDPNFAWAHEDLMLAYEQQGNHTAAANEAANFLRLTGEPTLADEFQHAFKSSGYDAALHHWAEVLVTQTGGRFMSPMKVAQLYARAGDREHAFVWLEKAFENRSAPLVYLRVDPRYDRVRSDPRFASLLERMKF
jgi:TolB-like protein/DNA-binding winged helix-turn-helix (wHTH) protein